MKRMLSLRASFGVLAGLCAIGVASVHADPAKPVPAHGPASMKELMTLVVEPNSNGIFQVGGEEPKSPDGWKTLQTQALTLLEVANTLTNPSRAKDKDQWMKDARALQASSKKAFDAAMAKNVAALTDLSDPLYETCAQCHEHYLPKK